MFVSCEMDAVDFPGLKSFALLVAAAQKEVEVYAGTEDEDCMQMGTIITSDAQRAQFRDAIQHLREYYKSELTKYNDRYVSITKMFVQTKFPEDGNDGEWYDGVMLTITYRWMPDLEFIEVHVKNHGQHEHSRLLLSETANKMADKIWNKIKGTSGVKAKKSDVDAFVKSWLENNYGHTADETNFFEWYEN